MTWTTALGLALASATVLVLAIPVVAFRIAVALIGRKRVGWTRALVAVLLAGLAQGCAGSALVGLDGGLLGVVVGWVAWSLVAGWWVDLPFGRAVWVGLAMALLSWLLWFALIVWLLFSGAALVLGLGAVSVLG